MRRNKGRGLRRGKQKEKNKNNQRHKGGYQEMCGLQGM
jgi:hypothetical protein